MIGDTPADLADRWASATFHHLAALLHADGADGADGVGRSAGEADGGADGGADGVGCVVGSVVGSAVGGADRVVGGAGGVTGGVTGKGLSWLPGIELYRDLPSELPYWTKTVRDFRLARRDELEVYEKRTGQSYGGGYVFTSIMMDSPSYLAWLEAQVVAMGGRIVQGRVTDLRGEGRYE